MKGKPIDRIMERIVSHSGCINTTMLALDLDLAHKTAMRLTAKLQADGRIERSYDGDAWEPTVAELRSRQDDAAFRRFMVR